MSLKHGLLLLTQLFLSLTVSSRAAYANEFSTPNAIELDNIPGLAKFDKCSGIIFKFDSSRNDERALFLTNGHCVHLPGQPFYLKHREFYYNLNFDKTIVLNSTGEELVIKRLVYATMSSTDIAVIELEKTYEELGIEVLVLGRNMTDATSHEIVVPSSYHRNNMTGKISQVVKVLKEAIWTWDDALILDLSDDFKKGSSGSPVILLSSSQIIGIGNTGNSGKSDCSIGNPCEVLENQETISFPGRVYGQQVFQIYHCLDSKNVFNLYLESCQLPK